MAWSIGSTFRVGNFMSKTLFSLLFRSALLGRRVATLEQNPKTNPLTILRLKSARQSILERTRRTASALVRNDRLRSAR
jgi:hypothetical protein